MGLFDFLKPKPAAPTLEAQESLRAAVAACARSTDPRTLAALEGAMSNALLFLGARELPSSIAPGPNVLDEDTEVANLESSTPSGDRVLFAFTTPDEVHARNPDLAIIGRPSKDVLEMVVENEFDLLAIDPAGVVLELSRADVARMFETM
jgi:hypothetical protein